MRQIVVDATIAQMKEVMDTYISTRTDTTSLAQATRAALETLDQQHGGQDGKGNAQDMMTYLRRRASRNQPEFSSFTMQLLKMCDPTPFPTLPCGNPTTKPVNHNTHPTQISLHLLLPTIQLLHLFLPTHTEDRFTPTFLIFPFSI
jgi:hypothetical protein